MMCKVIAEMHLAHAATLKEEGEEPIPDNHDNLQQALQALDPGFDPYMAAA